MTMTNEEKVRENRVRRRCKRMWIELYKSKAREPGAPDFQKYFMVSRLDGKVFGRHKAFGAQMTLDQVETHLDQIAAASRHIAPLQSAPHLPASQRTD